MQIVNSLPIRTRIALAIFFLSSLGLLVMSVAVYVEFRYQLRDNLDDAVALRAASAPSLIRTDSGSPTLAPNVDPEQEFHSGEAALRLYDEQGRLLSDASPVVPASGGELALARKALASGQERFGTVDTGGSGSFRFTATPLTVDGVRVALLTGLTDEQVSEPLATLRLIFLIAVPMTSAVLGIGGFFIARGALAPVAGMAATARRISDGDLDERIAAPRTEDEVGHLANTLNIMISRLAETIERERQFTADASHELRTPLTAIETSVDVTLSQRRTEEEYISALEVVRHQARRLIRLSRQLLLLARLDSRRVAQNFEEIRLRELCDAVAGGFSDQHPLARVELDCDGDPTIRGDVELLVRAISNMLENAVSHGRADAMIRLSIFADSDAVLRIADNGPGIPAGMADDVFQRFRRGDRARTGDGSGLGLAIVSAIMRAHGGSVRVVSGATGAVFELRLPVATNRGASALDSIYSSSA